MNRKLYMGLVLLCLSVLSACSSYRYSYYKAGDSYLNLAKYKTFAWAPTLPGRKPDSIVNDKKGLGARLNYLNNNKYFRNAEAVQKIREATVNTLQSKGLVLQENNPDLLVRYTTLVDKGTRNSYRYPYYGGFYGGWGMGWGYRFSPFYGGWGWPGYGGYGVPVKESFKEGVLAIELIDSRTRESVWIGYGAGELSRDPQKAVAQLPKVVDDIFKQLPVSRQ